MNRLVTIGHSYCVALNRRLADELQQLARDRWSVEVIAPNFFHGDFRPTHLETPQANQAPVKGYDVRFSKYIHIMHYTKEAIKYIQSKSITLLHIWEEPYIYAGFQIARHASRPLVYYTFQNLPKRYPLPFSYFEKYCLQRSAGWIAAGDTIQDNLEIKPHYQNRPHAKIPLGVDTKVFQPDPASRQKIHKELKWGDSNRPILGYLGRFVPEKGLGLLRDLRRHLRTPVRWLFVGNGALLPELQSWAAQDPEHVRICTSVKHDEVPAYLNAMDLLLAPSQTTPRWQEQLGRMLIEGFAVGLPVLASQSGEIPYVVEDAGILLPEADTLAWAEKIEQLLDSPSLRTELSLRGRQRAMDRFAWPVIAQQHWDFFHRIL